MQAVPDYESLGGGGVEEEEGRKKNKIYQHYTCRGDTIVAASNGSAANTECGSVYIHRRHSHDALHAQTKVVRHLRNRNI